MYYKEIYNILYQIYKKYQNKYKGNPDSEQLCCMWSTHNPPDIIDNTKPIYDIEKAFGITIDSDFALELYDMDVDEAAKKISNILKLK